LPSIDFYQIQLYSTPWKALGFVNVVKIFFMKKLKVFVLIQAL